MACSSGISARVRAGGSRIVQCFAMIDDMSCVGDAMNDRASSIEWL
jgi:hypothetical protein